MATSNRQRISTTLTDVTPGGGGPSGTLARSAWTYVACAQMPSLSPLRRPRTQRKGPVRKLIWIISVDEARTGRLCVGCPFFSRCDARHSLRPVRQPTLRQSRSHTAPQSIGVWYHDVLHFRSVADLQCGTGGVRLGGRGPVFRRARLRLTKQAEKGAPEGALIKAVKRRFRVEPSRLVERPSWRSVPWLLSQKRAGLSPPNNRNDHVLHLAPGHSSCSGSRNHRETAQLMAAPANERHEGAQDQDDHADDKQDFDHAMHHGRMAPHVHIKKGRPRAP